MKMLDVETKRSVKILQIYLNESEAFELKKGLESLLKDPEAKEHFHVSSQDLNRDLSISIVTKSKMENLSAYTKLEQIILLEE